MKRILLAGEALLAMAGVAQADPYAAMYGNTVTITGSDGMKLVTYVNQDMTWEQHNANGSVMKGTYTWKDGTTACFTTTDPAPKTPSQTPMCLANQVAHNVGDSWTVAGADGKPVTVAITAGR